MTERGETPSRFPAPAPSHFDRAQRAPGLFVLGAPRSGTTLVGAYVSSARAVCALGEFGAFHFTFEHAPKLFASAPGPYASLYVSEIQAHASSFAAARAAQAGCGWYCDHTPWNLLIASQLADRLPDARFLLVMRHYTGLVQSLRDSFEDGYGWCGADWSERARVWSRFYSHASDLPSERTVAISYDRLCHEPVVEIARLHNAMTGWGIDMKSADMAIFAKSHATSQHRQRPTIGHDDGDGLAVRPIPSWDASEWSPEIDSAIRVEVADAEKMLLRCYGDAYRAPEGYHAPISSRR